MEPNNGTLDAQKTAELTKIYFDEVSRLSREVTFAISTLAKIREDYNHSKANKPFVV